MGFIIAAAVLAFLATGMASTIAPRDRKNPTLIGGVAILFFFAVLLALAGATT